MQYIISGVENSEGRKENIGDKAKTLIKLKRHGFNIPDFFVISSDACDIHLLQKNIFAAYENIGGSLVAVRSSAIGEDGLKKSFAGQYKSLLCVPRERLISAIKECIASLRTIHALSYSQDNVINKMAVIVQKMVYPDISGVAFSADPVKNNKSVIIIESINGLCDALVSGTVNPDHYVLNKDKISEVNIPDYIRCVAKITKEIENKLKYHVDVEWAIQNGLLYILQARPITTLI